MDKYTIPVEVPKAVWEKYRSGKYKLMEIGDEYLSSDEARVFVAKENFTTQHRLVLTPRVTYPPELMSPEIWGIAVDEDGECRCHHGKPCVSGGCCWSNGDTVIWSKSLRALFPGIKLPTLADFEGDWKKASLQNPNWKGA